MHSDKESKMEKLSVLLLDVAGTITSLEYVKEKLLAFILEESPSYLKDHIEEEAVKNALKELQGNDKEIDVESSVEIIKKLTGQNSDDKNLKFLQALISKAGYEKGTLKAHIFPDVKVALANWSKDRKVAVYSSGDIEAQKLIFSNSVEGNLTSHISKFFDLSVGVKTAVESYNKISDELKVKCEEIVFVSDDPNELKAAKEAGLVTALMKREGNEEICLPIFPTNEKLRILWMDLRCVVNIKLLKFNLFFSFSFLYYSLVM
uniref:Enolase-phosphatase E1 n=1 Tax=Photinus pyralis TaxID=7054 RepID=A0A1Y1KSC3_PHOPY